MEERKGKERIKAEKKEREKVIHLVVVPIGIRKKTFWST